MRRRNIIAALVLIVCGATYAYFTSFLPERSLPNTPGPPFFPWVVTIILLGLSVALLLQGILGLGDSRTPIKVAASSSGLSNRPAVWALGLFVVYLVSLEPVGFVLATLPFFAILMWLFGERRLWLVALGAIGMTAFLYFVFRHGFSVFLPKGLLKGVVSWI